MDYGATTLIMEALLIFVAIVVPILLAASGVGFVVSLLQAATQIQEQTLPQTLKLLAVVGVIAIMAGSFTAPLVRYTEKVFVGFQNVGR